MLMVLQTACPLQKSCAPRFTAQLHRQTVSTGQRTQCFSEEAGWGTSIRKSVVEKKKEKKKKTSEENYWQMKLLFDKQLKQEEYLAEGFQRAVLDS